MDWLSLVPNAIIGGLAGFLSTSLFIWIRKPKPVDRNEFTRLRAEAVRIIEESNTNEFSRGLDISEASASKDIEKLRVFVKLGQHASYIHISSLISGMRVNRVRMKPSELTLEHILFGNEMSSAENNIIGGSGVGSDRDAVHKAMEELRRVMYYAFEHMDDSQRILSIVQDRKLTNLKQIKELLSVMKTSGNASLSEGML